MIKFIMFILILNCSKINLNLSLNYKEFEIEKEIIRAIKEDNVNEFRKILGDDVNKSLDIDNNSSLHYCAQFNSPKIIEFLLKNNKIDVDIQSLYTIQGEKIKKASPLHIACYQNHKNIVDMLIRKGANVHIEACRGYTPLHYAVIKNSKDCLELLIDNENINEKEKENGGSLIYYAALSDNEDLVKWLKERGANIDSYDYRGYTAIHRAIIEERPKALNILIKYGANLSLEGQFGVTCLYLATKRNNFNENVKEIIEMLLNNGCKIDEKSKNSWTPLSSAIYENNFSLAKFLIDKGANIRKKFNTNIQTAIRKENKNILLLFLKNLSPNEISIEVENFKFEILMDAMKDLGWNINTTKFKNDLNVLQALVENKGTKKELLYATEKNGADIKYLKGNQLKLYKEILSNY